MKTKEELIKEAIERGIKSGAVVRDYGGDVWTVPSWERATFEEGELCIKNLSCRHRNGSNYINIGFVVNNSGE